jgi:putative transcriptional regulator
MVREHIDTLDSLMARYVAGNLPTPARVLVESHLELRRESRGFVADLEAMAGEALAQSPPADFTDRDGVLARIFASSAIDDAPLSVASDARDIRIAGSSALPAALRDFIGFELDDVPWRTKMPGFKEFEIGEIDGCHASMFWIRPGRAVPAHTHHGCEISLVLQGAFADGHGRYGPGDISVADDDIDHRPVAENDRPCIGFAVTDAPLRLTGSFRQLIGDLIG